MSSLHLIKDKDFIVYRLVNENYIGVTTNIHKRLLKHRSRSNFDTSQIEILFKTRDIKEALNKELELQKIYNCKIGIRNQEGYRNPYAKLVLHKTTGLFFDTIKEAAACFNINYGSLRREIRNINNKFNLIRV